MPASVTLTEAQATLRELIQSLAPGQEVVITENNQPVAKLVPLKGGQRQPRRPGTLKGTVLYMAPDFDAPLEEFKEYME
ncbi:MAG TPA: type II toxin-antitoxin system prevent-host-death family antitoxin [Gemmataceae bacterium]|nr:type II toxin-antitoxin system prevent-host-death family antitoxin [Gemmataceae bacterium]